MRTETEVTVDLTCGHMTTAPIDTVLTNNPIECWACTQQTTHIAYRTWATFRAMTEGWYFRCQNCPYRRSYGDRRLACLTTAEKHGRKRHHDLSVGLDGVHQQLVSFTVEQPALPTDQPNF